ncbi:gastrula zinc finger protein XlCGF7.1 [Folsomia candida]|uniref:gastrula zinc finger protein XlCGF7.1 n=1 Tax=Folsomia candida TaxID=158441 RepID=UPI000B907FE9|nr:gastrula zinc finger protein XlCGF7.1 [Folsomia candida]
MRSLEKHTRSNHAPRESLTCAGCDNFFPYREQFHDHVNEASVREECRERAIFCAKGVKQCKLAFSSEHAYRIHVTCCHSETNPFACAVPGCGKSFGHRSALNSHKWTHSAPQDDLVCERCGKTFKLQSGLRDHIKSVHLSREEGAARFTCDICGKGLIDKSKLARHRKIHIDPADAPHLCTLCGKRFRLNEYLNIHMRSHDPDRQEKYPQYMRKKKSKDAGVRMGVAGAKIGRPVVVKKVGTTTGDQNLGKLD